MRFSRLVIEADQNSVSLALHPRLTVIAGVDAPVREALATELIGGLQSTRSGVHLELTEDRGRKLAVFRPRDGDHRVINANDRIDVTDEFRAGDGRIDLLAHYGLDSRKAYETLFLNRDRLQTEAPQDTVVNRLAELDQPRLWSLAARVRVTENELLSLNEGIDHAEEDSDLVATVERRHQSLESAVAKQREIQRDLVRVAAFSLALALPVGLAGGTGVAPLLAIATIVVVLAFIYRARVDSMKRSEASALAAAGSDSYLGFVVKRVDGMMTSTEQHRKLAGVAEDHRAAAIQWTRLAGDVSVEWALAHHHEIEGAARLRHDLAVLNEVSTTAPQLDDDVADLALSLISHMSHLRRVGPSGESLPLLLDDPFGDLPSATRHSLLELLARSSSSQQVILFTDRDDVADWARLEALTGGVSLVEPLADAGRQAGVAV